MTWLGIYFLLSYLIYYFQDHNLPFLFPLNHRGTGKADLSEVIVHINNFVACYFYGTKTVHFIYM